MRRIHPIVIALVCALLLAAASNGHSHRRTSPEIASKTPPITFTLETKEKVVQFFEPIVIRVVLHNNLQSSIYVNSQALRLIPESWHVVGTWGEWMEGEGVGLQPESRPAGRIEISPASSLVLLTVAENPTFERLGPVRVAYKLSSTDSATKQLLPSEYSELSVEIPPTKLISAVWNARTQRDRELVQPDFNEFLKFRAAAQKEDGKNFQKRLRNHGFAAKTIFYMAGYALPFLADAAKDKDPFIREQAVLAYSHAARAIDQLDAYLDALDAIGPRPQWALTVFKNTNRDKADWRSFALGALSDSAANVRIAAVSVLTKTDWDQYEFDALESSIGTPKRNATESMSPASLRSSDQQVTSREFDAVKALSTDSDSGVRAAVQSYLAGFAGKNAAADTVVEALTDQDSKVREKAVSAFLHSPQPPPLETIKRAFAMAKEETAASLIPLLFEQENSSLSATLDPDFIHRSEAERLLIMTVIAGHSDSTTLDLVKLGLNDPSAAVQSAALMRLLAFTSDTATPLIESYLRRAPAELRSIAQDVKTETQSQRLFPFLKVKSDQLSASESGFPSLNGTTPVTSPDGQWIAYVETGWGRPGGSGGFGRSNLISISHVVRKDGTDDRVVSDMFLVSWLSDSQRLGTARDGFAAISNLTGKVVAEFGDSLEEKYRGTYQHDGDWTKADLRSQVGAFMPHQKHFNGMEDFGFGEGGAFSPDGKFYGPLRDIKTAFFLGVDGKRVPLKLRLNRFGGPPAGVWSPDGGYVVLFTESGWTVIDMQTLMSHEIRNVDSSNFPGDCYAQCRWSPWSKDGKKLTFVRGGQVWTSGPNGEDAKQITFDGARKAFPTFSRDGNLIAYLTWQPDDRLHYTRLGPTDLWVVDIASTLATRVTAPKEGRINSLDWLDDHTLVFDRIEQQAESGFPQPRSSLRRISLVSGSPRAR